MEQSAVKRRVDRRSPFGCQAHNGRLRSVDIPRRRTVLVGLVPRFSGHPLMTGGAPTARRIIHVYVLDPRGYESWLPDRPMRLRFGPDRPMRCPMSRHSDREVDRRPEPAGRFRHRPSWRPPLAHALSRSRTSRSAATSAARTPLSRGGLASEPSVQAGRPDRTIAPRRFFHQPSGRLPITFMASTIHRCVIIAPARLPAARK